MGNVDQSRSLWAHEVASLLRTARRQPGPVLSPQQLWELLRELLRHHCEGLNLEAGHPILNFEVQPKSLAIVRRLDVPGWLRVEFDLAKMRVVYRTGEESGEYVFARSGGGNALLMGRDEEDNWAPLPPGRIAEKILNLLLSVA